MPGSIYQSRSVPWVALALAVTLAVDGAAAPFISPEIAMDAALIGGAWQDQVSPAVAFNGTHYLAVWQDYRDAGTDIYAARITTNGIVLDPGGIAICTEGSPRLNLVVAASGENFLVAWGDERNDNRSIYAATVTSLGTVRETNGVFIASSFDSLTVAGNGTDFLLVWDTYNLLNAYDIYGVRISGTGVTPGLVPFDLSGQPGWETAPAVASRGGDYLVVWQDTRNGNDDIYGARISGGGNVLDPDGFPISAGPPGQSLPTVAAGASNYLVAWEDERNANMDIYAARVAANGTVMDTNGFAIARDAVGEHFPRAVATASNFTVFWSASDDPWVNVNAATVTPGGSVSSAVPVGVHYYSSAGLFNAAASAEECLLVWSDYSDVFGTRITATGTVREPSGFLISTGPNAERSPSVAFNGSMYLVVWQDNRYSTNFEDHIYGMRVAADGSVLDANAIPICTSSGSQFSPAVTALNGQFLVVWSDSRNGWTDIYGARVREDGFVLDTDGIAITTNAYTQRASAVAANNNEYLVVWRDDRNCPSCKNSPDDIYGARVSFDGMVMDAKGFPISLGPAGQQAPAIASNGEEFLVVWRDDRGPFDTDIYGAVVSEGEVVTGDIPISKASGNQRAPEVSSDGNNFLVVWRDQRNYSTNDYDIYGARVDRFGTLVDTNGIAICSALSLQTEPAVAFGGIDYLVTWHDYRTGTGNDIYGSRVSTAGAVLDESGFLINAGIFDPDILAVAAAGNDNFIVVGEGRRGGAPRALGNVVAFGELPPPPPPNDSELRALNNWQARFSLPMTNDLLALAFGDGRFAGGGSAGRLIASANGADWNIDPALPGFNGSLNCLVYGDGQFVGGSGVGMYLRSPDGISWQAINGPALYSITYGNGRFVAVGIQQFFTSLNATNWTFGLVGANQTLNGVAYGGGMFVAVGGNGAIWRSSTGSNWTAAVSPTNLTLRGIAYGNGRFIAVGTNGIVLSSMDATNWTALSLNPPVSLNAVTYAGTLFVAVGNNGAIVSSRDGVDWARHSSPTLENLYALAYGSGIVIAVGARGTILLSDTLRYSAPMILSQPPATIALFVGGATNLSVAATGTSPRHFQWLKDNQPIAGANNDVLPLSNLGEIDSGSYTVAITNAYGSVVSEPTALTAAFRVAIVQPPLSQSIVRGGTLTVSVLVTGTPPYSFEWRRGGLVLASNVSSSPLNFLTITNIQIGGAHQVRVRNPAPVLGVAGNLTITLLADSDGDGLPDEWEAAYNFGTNNPADATADPDLDGFPNLAEYQAGTDPTDGTSYLKVDAIRLSQQANSVFVDFQAVSNRTYTLLGRPELHAGAWTPLADIVARSSNRTVTITNTLSTPPAARFYRLVTPCAP